MTKASKLIFTSRNSSSSSGSSSSSSSSGSSSSDSSCLVVDVVVPKTFNFTFLRFREFWQSLPNVPSCSDQSIATPTYQPRTQHSHCPCVYAATDLNVFPVIN